MDFITAFLGMGNQEILLVVLVVLLLIFTSVIPRLLHQCPRRSHQDMRLINYDRGVKHRVIDMMLGAAAVIILMVIFKSI